MYVFHRMVPVVASRATTLPRKLQHGYPGITVRGSSREDTPT
jgi:hypothetical protein